jgi:hypothetical protein
MASASLFPVFATGTIRVLTITLAFCALQGPVLAQTLGPPHSACWPGNCPGHW